MASQKLRLNLAQGHGFVVLLGEHVFSCRSVSGIGNEIKAEPFYQGGAGDRPVFLTSSEKPHGTLVFQHGIGRGSHLNKSFLSALQGRWFPAPGTILVLGDEWVEEMGGKKKHNKIVVRSYAFDGGIPVKWSLSDLNAEEGGILIDTLEILHRGIYEINVNITL